MSSEEKRDVCKICGIEIGYYRIDKGNGKSTHRAIHIGEPVPENANEISKYEVSSTYRNRMRQAFKHDGAVTQIAPARVKKTPPIASPEEDSDSTESIITPIESSTGVGVLTGVRPDDDVEPEASPKLIMKEKLEVVKPAIEYMEVHEFPEGSENKPEVDISEIKRNKFAVVGAIARKLTEVGMATQKVSDIRSNLIANGGNFPGIIRIASEHLRFVENGQPLFFRQ